MDYKEMNAIGIVRLMLTDGVISQEVAGKYFPELAESEDEKIRKVLIDWVSMLSPSHFTGELSKEKVLAYLEKQGEQKPADKVEPKFKVGDWVKAISSGNIFKILSVNDGLYRVLCYDGVEANYPIEVEKDLAYWTIQDAKDGDVLCTYECGKPKIVFILKGMPKKPYVLGYHCYYNIMFPNLETNSEKGCLAPNDEDVKPATKEQRGTLMKAMADDGYTFDFEKKELKKIEQKPAVIIPKFRIGDEIKTSNEESLTITKIDEKGYWSEDLFICGFDEECIWELVEQKPVEWSEKDEDNILHICCWLNEYGNLLLDKNEDKSNRIFKTVDWLKSLRPQKKQECAEPSWLNEADNDEELLIAIEAWRKLDSTILLYG